jgi:hypothetical protein
MLRSSSSGQRYHWLSEAWHEHAAVRCYRHTHRSNAAAVRDLDFWAVVSPVSGAGALGCRRCSAQLPEQRGVAGRRVTTLGEHVLAALLYDAELS